MTLRRPAAPSPSALAVSLMLAISAGCALVRGGPEPDPRECFALDAENLPPLEETLDPTEIVSTLRSSPADADVIVLTIAVREDRESIRIFSPDQENGATLGTWPVVLRDALRMPLPEASFPGVRVRLIPGPEGRAELEPVTLCPPNLRNPEELAERYRAQMADVADPPVVDAVFDLSDLGGILTLRIDMPEGTEELELPARRALHFARFEPALVDGRRVSFTVRMRFPPEA